MVHLFFHGRGVSGASRPAVPGGALHGSAAGAVRRASARGAIVGAAAALPRLRAYCTSAWADGHGRHRRRTTAAAAARASSSRLAVVLAALRALDDGVGDARA